ncbi:MAG TPA: GH25 family lysozyme [Micromonosporaceae bacterium]
MAGTVYGWDASHYDGTLTKAILARARSEGIQFFTHKLGEGLGNVDPTQATALSAARSAGITLIGGYWFIHDTDGAVASAKKCIATADAHESWWRDFPGWFWQTDAEVSSTGLPSPSYIETFSNYLANETGKRCIVYASRGMYGNRLTGVHHKLWNADYGSNPHGGFKSVYPGNSSRGWTAYSGQTPYLLQFSSNATIAGRTTCDANAFRGTLQELAEYIEGDDMPLTTSDIDKIVAAVWNKDGTTPNYPWMSDAATNTEIKAISAVKDGANQAHEANVGVAALTATLAGQAKQINALVAAVTATQGDNAANADAVLSAIQSVGSQESDQVAALQAQITTMRATLNTTNEHLAAANAALAAAQAAVATPAAPAASAPVDVMAPPAQAAAPALEGDGSAHAG